MNQSISTCSRQIIDSADDILHCISLELQRNTSQKWEAVAYLPFSLIDAAVSYYQIEGLCNDVFKNVGSLKLTIIVWKAM